MEKAIRIRVLGKEYALRVKEEDEAFTQRVAAYVDAQMQAFKSTHPEQPELTVAVVVALAIAEELMTEREAQQRAAETLEATLRRFEQQLADALAAGAAGPDGEEGHGA